MYVLTKCIGHNKLFMSFLTTAVQFTKEFNKLVTNGTKKREGKLLKENACIFIFLYSAEELSSTDYQYAHHLFSSFLPGLKITQTI